MAVTFKKQLETMSMEELEQLKDKLFQEMDDCPRLEAWRTRESLNMKITSIGQKIMKIACVIYAPDSEEFKACKEKVHRFNPHYRKLTETEKNEKVLHMISNELEAESQFLSARTRRLGYRSRYPRRNEEKQYE